MIKLAEKLATCALILGAVCIARVLLRMTLLRCCLSVGSAGASLLPFPVFEGPCLLSQFWGITDLLAQGVGSGCTFFTQMLSLVLLFCGPILALGMFSRHVMLLQREGALVFDKNNLTFSETWQNLRAATGLKEKYGLLKAWLSSGSWDVEVDARVARIDFLIGDYK